MRQFYPNLHSKDLVRLYDIGSRSDSIDEEAFRNDNPEFNFTEFKYKTAATPLIVAATLSRINLVSSFTDHLTPFGVCKSLKLGIYIIFLFPRRKFRSKALTSHNLTYVTYNLVIMT